MLTKRDLRWTWLAFWLYSKMLLMPVTFKPVMLGGDGGQMESGEISWRRTIGFKMTQILYTCQALFCLFRTLEYMKWGEGGFFGTGSNDEEEDVDLDWDFVPIMLIFTITYFTFLIPGYLVWNVGAELNTKVFNELIRLRGKTNQ